MHFTSFGSKHREFDARAKKAPLAQPRSAIRRLTAPASPSTATAPPVVNSAAVATTANDNASTVAFTVPQEAELGPDATMVDAIVEKGELVGAATSTPSMTPVFTAPPTAPCAATAADAPVPAPTSLMPSTTPQAAGTSAQRNILRFRLDEVDMALCDSCKRIQA